MGFSCRMQFPDFHEVFSGPHAFEGLDVRGLNKQGPTVGLLQIGLGQSLRLQGSRGRLVPPKPWIPILLEDDHQRSCPVCRLMRCPDLDLTAASLHSKAPVGLNRVPGCSGSKEWKHRTKEFFPFHPREVDDKDLITTDLLLCPATSFRCLKQKTQTKKKMEVKTVVVKTVVLVVDET